MDTIGMIGLGLMGLPMAQNLVESGFRVIGYRRGDASDFIKSGGELVSSPATVMDAADIILCCIPSDTALRDVVSGPNGFTSTDCGGKIVVELSTLSETVKRDEAEKLAARGATMLDGAISGLPPMVKAKTAVFFLSGADEAFETARPVLGTLTQNLYFMGAFGAASKTKLCANMLVAANLAAIAETLSFGAKQGLELGRLVAALGSGAGTSVQFNARAEKMASGDWSIPLGATAMLAKDVKLIADAAAAAGCPVPVLNGVRTVYDAAMAGGYGDKDVASIFAPVAQAAGLPIPGEKT